MRVVVAGATGALGRHLVPRLVAAGHEVTGLTRSAAKAPTLRALGARPAVANALDPAALAPVVAEARPEVVVHQLTDLAAVLGGGSRAAARAGFVGTNRLRTEGTRNLLAAATEAGARRVVAQSVAFWYAPGGGPVKAEDAPLWRDAPEPLGSAVRAAIDLEDQLRAAPLEPVVLRYGSFYGPGTTFRRDGAMGREVLRGRLPIVGRGDGVASFVHVADAAAATAAAVEAGPPGTYNVADDDPAPMRAWLPAFAAALGAPRPRTVPAWLARLVVGPAMAAWAAQQRGASNARAKAALGWAPRFRSWREGFRDPGTADPDPRGPPASHGAAAGPRRS